MNLATPEAGDIVFEGIGISDGPERNRKSMQQGIQYIFQDPLASLDPKRTIGASIAEPMYIHGLAQGREARDRVADLLEQVELPADCAARFPHEFSGGQRQRICIARALAAQPRLIIADESVAALDVSVQAQIVDLLIDLQRRHRVSYLFISHDMAVVERISHRVAVMHLGQIVEIGSRRAIFETPQHPYTRQLLAAAPVADPTRRSLPVMPPSREIPSPVRAVGDPPARHSFRTISPGHLVAEI